MLAQNVLSCGARTEKRFGFEHVAYVLVGAGNDRAAGE